MKKVIVWIVALLVLAGLGFGAWRYQKAHAAPDARHGARPVSRAVHRASASRDPSLR